MKRISWAAFSRRRGLKIKDWFSKPNVSTYEDLVRVLDQVNVIAPPEDDPEVIAALSSIKKEEQTKPVRKTSKDIVSPKDSKSSSSSKPKRKRVAKTKESATSNESK